MKGVILGITMHDYKTDLKVNDLISVDGHFFNLEKIDPRFMRNEGEPNNENMYFIIEPVSGQLMNYKRDEISKASIGIFDYDKYYNENKKLMIGNLNPDDLRNIKAKHALEWDVPTDKIDSITFADILELSFEGEIVTKEYSAPYPDAINTTPTIVKYFKVS